MPNRITRRRFLHIATVSAGTIALGGLTACGSDDNNDQPATAPPPPAPQIVSGASFYPQSVASGDPRPDSVILWTRVQAPAGDQQVRLQVARDESFGELVVDSQFTAPDEHDHCLKVRVTELTADTRYFYRFLFLAEGNFQASRTGRTRTAPAPDSTRTVRFGHVSCQDYVGRYYNTYLKLLEEDLDFVLHLGDYVYETTGDPLFQGGAAERVVSFRAPDEAISLGGDESGFAAARSLGNYRDLYRTYRADPVLQRIHERFPIVATWDDHEYSNDHWQATGTYFNGRRDEADVQRKRDAETAWFEYMPVDPEGNGTSGGMGAFFNESNRFPDTRIFRDFRFGANVHLLLTDYRTYRPDHLIPEDAFPGTVAVTEGQLAQLLALQGVDFAQVRDSFSPYVNIDEQPFATLRPLLVGVTTEAYVGAGVAREEAQTRADAVIRGNLATTVINNLISAFNATVPPFQRAPLLDETIIAGAERGIAFFTMGKTSLFSDLGSRLFVVKDTFDLYAAAKYVFEGPQTQRALGLEQDLWLRDELMHSDARWKLVANACSNTSLVLDLSDPQLGVPAPFNQRFYLNVDQWDGFPNQRAEYLAQVYGPASGVVLLAGDIHASFVTDHGEGTVELTTSSVSSSTFSTLVANAAAADPVLSQLAGPLLPLLDPLLASTQPGVRHLQTTRNGVSIVEASADALVARYFELPEDQVFVNRYDDAAGVIADMVEVAFRVDDGGLTRIG